MAKKCKCGICEKEFMTSAGFRSAIEKSNLLGTKFGETNREK